MSEVREKRLLKDEELEEIVKLSPEEQIIRLEKILEMTQFIEKEPQKQQTKQPTSKERPAKQVSTCMHLVVYIIIKAVLID